MNRRIDPSNFPWPALRDVFRLFRTRFFTIEAPTYPPYTARGTAGGVASTLGRRSYAPNWEFSYHKRGEDLNLARVFRYEHPEYPDIDWWQIHVRGWEVETESGTYVHLRAHFEPEPTEHPDEHLADVNGYSIEEGMGALGAVLDTTGLRLSADPREENPEYARTALPRQATGAYEVGDD